MPPTTIIDVLIAYNALPGDGTRSFITRNGNYLSGIPYLWTMFGERAFIFPSEQHARDLLERFPTEFAGATIGHFSH